MSWGEVSLGELEGSKGDFVDGPFGSNLKASEYVETGVPIIQLKNIKPNQYIEKDLKFVTQDKADSLKRHSYQAGDVCIAKLGAVGTACIIPETAPNGVIVADVVRFRGDRTRIDYKYLCYFLNSAIGQQRILAFSRGSTRTRTNLGDLKKVKIPLPPLDEQKRIAAILDKANAIRQKRKQAIDFADEFLRSVFLDMFGDPLDPNSKVMTLPMTEVFNITTGKLNSNAAVEGGQYPFFTCAKEIFAIDDYAFEQEALLLAGNNAQADYDVKHFSGKFNAYQRTYVLTLKDEQQSYPFYKFALEYQLKNLKRFSKGSNTKYITMEIMERTMLPVPSNTLQHEFVQKYSKKAELLKSYSLQADFLNSNFNSLSQKAFSGQL